MARYTPFLFLREAGVHFVRDEQFTHNNFNKGRLGRKPSFLNGLTRMELAPMLAARKAPKRA